MNLFENGNPLAYAIVDRIVAQPEPRDALLRFLYFTEAFVERFDLEPIAPHLGEDELAALRAHFRDEAGHARALRVLCERHGLDTEPSPAEAEIIARSDEGYGQFLRHLDPETQRFTAAEMYAYYAHVEMQEELAAMVYALVADALDRHGVRPKFARLLRALVRSEEGHQGYADGFMKRYADAVGPIRRRLIERKVRLWSARTGLSFLRAGLRVMADEHGLRMGPLTPALARL